MSDPTEHLRRDIIAEINANPNERAELEKQHGRVWDAKELQEAFNVHSFLVPFVLVTNKATGTRGTLTFQHSPRYYFGFMADGG